MKRAPPLQGRNALVTAVFTLRLPPNQIAHWASRYRYPGEPELMAGPAVAARTRGYLLLEDLVEFGVWKTPRNRRHYESNDPLFVEEVTRIALSRQTSPRLSIETLTLLSGFEWPTASVILHFCHADPYPILDFRALWSLSCDVPAAYDYSFWMSYTAFTRRLATQLGHDMRTIDRALWEYSKENQRNGA